MVQSPQNADQCYQVPVHLQLSIQVHRMVACQNMEPNNFTVCATLKNVKTVITTRCACEIVQLIVTCIIEIYIAYVSSIINNQKKKVQQYACTQFQSFNVCYCHCLATEISHFYTLVLVSYYYRSQSITISSVREYLFISNTFCSESYSYPTLFVAKLIEPQQCSLLQFHSSHQSVHDVDKCMLHT